MELGELLCPAQIAADDVGSEIQAGLIVLRCRLEFDDLVGGVVNRVAPAGFLEALLRSRTVVHGRARTGHWPSMRRERLDGRKAQTGVLR